MLKFLVSLSIFCATITSSSALSHGIRLSRDVLPKSYNLKIVPDPDTKSFSGQVTILVNVKNSTKSLILNSKHLSIKRILLDQSFDHETRFELHPDEEVLEVYYDDRKYIEPGEHILHAEFEGNLNGNTGFYYIEHKQRNNSKTTRMFATKFSPIYARTAFPCFDEPFFKSIFSIRLVKPRGSDWTALSNMKQINSFESDEGTVVDFRSSVPMSSYLLAWVLTEYPSENLTHTNTEGKQIEMRFFSSENRKVSSRKALEISRFCLQFFEEYTGIAFPISKLDSIEIPGYRSSGMEHWGLIVYHENAVTRDNSSVTSELFHSISSSFLIAHEISHMWFGNLVTHEWYNDLWLTEGFARFMQFRAIKKFFGGEFIDDFFQSSYRLSLFKSQCENEFRRLETAFYPRHLHEIYQKYSATTYDQGGALLFMLEDLIGEEKFKKFIRNYLKKHAYELATTGDFINEIQEIVPEINLRNFLESYLFQKRLPLIYVNENAESFVLHQTTLCKSYFKNTIFHNKWTVPIKYITSGSQNAPRTVWFDRDMTKLVIPKSKNDEWIKINHKNLGLYGSLYSSKLYNNLIQNFKFLIAQDHHSLIEDTFYLSANELLNCSIPLQIINEIRSLPKLDFITFIHASRSASIFVNFMSIDDDTQNLLETYFTYVFENIFNKISWTAPMNSANEKFLRVAVFESYCMFNYKHKDCLLEAERLRATNSKADQDIEYIVSAILKNSKQYNNENATLTNNEHHSVQSQPLLKSTPMDKNEDEVSEYKKECSLWIKENIPKIMNRVNLVS